MPQPVLKPHLRPSSTPLYLGTAFLLIALVYLAQPLLSHQPWLVFEQDDFFYYLQVARNLAHTLGSVPLASFSPAALARASTANGLVPTNGYHPLWLLVLTAACAVSTTGPWLASVLLTAGFSAVAATLLLSLHLLRRLARLTLAAALPFALATTVYALKLFFDGMEVTLTIPLALASLALLGRRFTPRAVTRAGSPGLPREPLHPSQPAETASAVTEHTGAPKHFVEDLALALLLSLTVLSRLDSALLLALLVAGLLATPSLRRQLSPARVAAFLLGLAPLALYLLVNQHFFGTALPISGVAKQLRTSHVPSAAVWQSVTGPGRLSPLKLAIPLATLVLLPLDLLRRRSASDPAPLSPVATLTLAALGLFPLVHLCVLSIVSDWRLWPWYLYPFRLAFLSSLILLARVPALRALLLRPATSTGLDLLGLLAVLLTRPDTAQTTSILRVANDLAHFARTHPAGTYAMGDRSGLVAWLLPDPVVQTEGLTMDPAFVSLIRDQRPLIEVLRQYGVRYYVATLYLPPHTPIPSCIAVAEPFQAGPTSAHMRATLCSRPVARFFDGEFPTLVFDLSTLPAHYPQPAAP